MGGITTNSGIMKIYNLIISFCICFLLVGCNLQIPNSRKSIEIDFNEVAIMASKKINDLNLQKFNPETVANTKNFLSFIKSLNNLAGEINKNTNYDIPLLDVSIETIDKTVSSGNFLLRYAPLIEPYNALLDASLNVDLNNSDTITDFYYSIGFFVFDVAVLEMKLVGKAVTYGTNYAWDYAKVTGLISKQNLKSIIYYGSSTAYDFIRIKIIPFVVEQIKNSSQMK